MTRLVTFDPNDRSRVLLDTEDADRIAAEIASCGARLERWTATAPISAEASADEILSAYAPSIERLKRERGYQVADVIHVRPGNPAWPAMREKFLVEHTHDEDEVRFFVEGSGAFYLHVGNLVHQVTGTAGDLLTVPANFPHWFDGGPVGSFTVIRVFGDPKGWIAHYTGDTIAASIPLFEPA